jgi:DNA-binding Xre family transcriptional regulator
LQALLAEKAGVQLSNQAISALINGQPNALRLQTIQALCNAVDYKLSDFCEVLPDTAKEQQKQRKVAGGTPVRLYGAKEPSKNQENIFPDPHQYTETKKGQQGKGKGQKG